jgi:hypothetical protein
MSNYIEDVVKQLRGLKKHERVMVMIMMLVEIIEREYFLVQKLKQELLELEKEVKKNG